MTGKLTSLENTYPSIYVPDTPAELFADAYETGGFTEHEFMAKLGSKSFECTYFESDNPTTDVPIVLIPGFMETKLAVKPMAEHIAGRRHAIIYPPLREQDRKERLSFRHSMDAFIHQSNVVHQVIEAYSGETGMEEFDLVGHSMGNPILLYVAYNELIRDPKGFNIRSGISHAGAGLHADGALDAAFKFFRHFPDLMKVAKNVPKVLDAIPERDREALKQEALNHISDVDRLAREGLTVLLRPKSLSKLQKLREQTDFRYAAIMCERDGLFFEEDVRRISGHLLDEIVTVSDADHTHGNTHPELHAQLITDTFEKINEQDAAA